MEIPLPLTVYIFEIFKLSTRCMIFGTFQRDFKIWYIVLMCYWNISVSIWIVFVEWNTMSEALKLALVTFVLMTISDAAAGDGDICNLESTFYQYLWKINTHMHICVLLKQMRWMTWCGTSDNLLLNCCLLTVTVTMALMRMWRDTGLMIESVWPDLKFSIPQ